MTVALNHELSGPSDRPTVLMIGGLGTSLEVWDRQLPDLYERFRVVRAELRGHGRTPAPPGPYALDDLVDDLLRLLDSHAIDRTHVVGHSFGGMVAMRLAAREPDRVDRLVLLCTAAQLGTPEMWQERAEDVRTRGSESVAPEIVEAWLTPDGREPGLVETLQAMVAATPSEGLAACCEAIAALDLRDDLPVIAAPTLTIAGAEDAGTPPGVLADIAAAVPDGRATVVDNAAHLPMIEQPDAVAEALLKHLGAD